MILYKSENSLTTVQATNSTFYTMIYEILRSIKTYYFTMAENYIPPTQSQPSTFRIANILKYQEMFRLLEEDVLSKIMHNIDDVSNVMLQIIIPYMVVLILLRVVMIFEFFRFSRIKYDITNTIFFMKAYHIEQQLATMSSLLKRMEEDKVNYIQEYSFNLFNLDA